MWTAAASWSRAASAAQTHESMPPLSSTTARDWPLFDDINSLVPSDVFESWIPNELVQLQPQPGRNVVGNHPLGQLPGIEQTMRGVAGARCIVAEGRRKQRRIHPCRKIVLPHKLP